MVDENWISLEWVVLIHIFIFCIYCFDSVDGNCLSRVSGVLQ